MLELILACLPEPEIACLLKLMLVCLLVLLFICLLVLGCSYHVSVQLLDRSNYAIVRVMSIDEQSLGTRPQSINSI